MSCADDAVIEEMKEAAFLGSASSRGSRTVSYDLDYAAAMLSHMLSTTLPGLIADMKSKRTPGVKVRAPDDYKRIIRWLDEVELGKLCHDFLKEVWAELDEEDERAESGDERLDLQVSALQLGRVFDRIYAERMRSMLSPAAELKGLGQGLRGKQQRALRNGLREARKRYLQTHMGNEAED